MNLLGLASKELRALGFEVSSNKELHLNIYSFYKLADI